jgi:hypothetical protein
MSELAGVTKGANLTKILLVANLFFWIYFAIAFSNASYRFTRDVWNYDPIAAPAGFTFFGHSIGIRESAFQHGFFRTMFCVEFPSFAVARLGQNLFFPHVAGNAFFAGISEGGWRLLVVALLSFVQWYFIGRLAQKLRHRWARNQVAPANNVVSTQLGG